MGGKSDLNSYGKGIPVDEKCSEIISAGDDSGYGTAGEASSNSVAETSPHLQQNSEDESGSEPLEIVSSIPQTQTFIKKRTRQNKAPIVEGNNKKGRAGCKVCLECRRGKQGCVYESESLPCKRCMEKRYPCGEKLLKNRYIQMVKQNPEVRITATEYQNSSFSIPMVSQDFIYLNTLLHQMENVSIDQFLESVTPAFASPAYFVGSCSIRPVKDLIKDRYGLFKSQTAFRHSALVFASFILNPTFNGEPNRHNREYLERFDFVFQQALHSWTSEAIIHPLSLVDTVHATAMMLVWALSSGQRLGIVHTYVEALRDAFASLCTSSALMAHVDTGLVQCLCLCAFEGLDNCLVDVDHLDEMGHLEHVLSLLDDVSFPIFEILEVCFDHANPGASSLPFDEWSPRREILMRLGNLLNILVALYFRTGPMEGTSPRMGGLIVSVLHKTVDMILQLSRHFERARYFLDHIFPQLVNIQLSDPAGGLDYRDIMHDYNVQDEEMSQFIVFGLAYLINEITSSPDMVLSTSASIPIAIVLCRMLSAMTLRWYRKPEVSCLILAAVVVKPSVDPSVHEWIASTFTSLHVDCQADDSPTRYWERVWFQKAFSAAMTSFRNDDSVATLWDFVAELEDMHMDEEEDEYAYVDHSVDESMDIFC